MVPTPCMSASIRPEPTRPVEPARAARWPRVAVVVLLGALALGWIAAVGTKWGQRVDDAGLAGGFVRKEQTGWEAYWHKLGWQIDWLLGLGAAVPVVIALGRRNVRLARDGFVAIAAVVAIATVVKVVLPHPALSGSRSPLVINTYPSGHVATATVVGGCLVLAVGRRFRGFAAIVGLSLIGTVAWVTLTGGWHRMSDTIAGVMLGGVASLVVLVRAGEREDRARIDTVIAWLCLAGGALALLVAAGALAPTVLALWRGEVTRPRQFTVLGWSRTATVAAGAAMLGTVVLALPARAGARPPPG